MPGRYCLYFLLLSVTFSCGGAAIQPKDVKYDAKVGDDQQIPWVYDNAADMFTVLWTYATSASAAQTNIMSQSAGSAVNIIKSNVEHNGNGAITLKNVTQSDSGVYYCEVSYSLGSGHSPVTGTATLSVTVPPDTTTTTSTTTTTRPTYITTTTSSTAVPLSTIIGACVGGLFFLVIVLSIIICYYLRHKRNLEKKEKYKSDDEQQSSVDDSVNPSGIGMTVTANTNEQNTRAYDNNAYKL